MADDSYEKALENEGRNLVAAARRELLPPTDFRDDDVRAALDQLDRGRSVLLVGPQGVGKTAVVHGVARAIAARDMGELVELSTTTIMAGTRYLGEWQSKITAIARNALDTGTILYIPDVGNLPRTGRTNNSDGNLLDALRPYVARGLVLLGEVSPEGLRAMGRTPGFTNLFSKVTVRPLRPAQVEGCVARMADRMELGLDTPCRQAIIALTSRFLPARPQPGPALDLLRQVRDYHMEKRGVGEPAALTPAFVERVFSIYSGLPPFVVSRTETRPVSDIRRWFQERIVGQQEAIEAVIEAITLFKAGLHDPTRPLGTFFFVGPTGVGKTELARTLATFLFGSPHRLLRFDLSEFKDYHSFEILLGSPREPDRPAALIDPVRAQPFQVVLFDELEKAHSNVWDLILPLLDEGRLTPPGGQSVDFRNTMLIATSNVGAQDADRSLGFGASRGATERRTNTLKALESHFRPEFLNRFQHVVVFHQLTLEQVRTVARHELRRILGREGITARNLVVDVDDAALDLVIEQGFDPRYGARALKREIQRQLVLPLATALMERAVEPGQILKLVEREGRIRVRVIDTAESREARREAAPIRVETGARLTRPDIVRRLKVARQRLEVLAEAIREPILQDGRERLLQMRKGPNFWQDTQSAARALRDLDRVTVVLDRMDRLRSFYEELNENLDAAQRRARLEEVASKLVRFEEAVTRARRELLLMGWEGSWDALVEVSPIGVGGRLARDHLVMVYLEWASEKGRSLEWLRDPLEDDEPVLMAVKGPYAFGLLQNEGGLHRVRGDEYNSVARVRVAAWTDERGAVQFKEHRALKGGGTYGQRVRSRLVCADGLVLCNERTLTDNRELANELAPSWTRAPAPSDEVVRRYDLQPTLVRDAMTGFSSGKPDALNAAGLHALLCLRVDAVAEKRRAEKAEATIA
ncbi:MAG: AAA family ATPase [Alphaproteobacteria bacterium]|nr:AAA family ATPase [Alphaproteobacteria bacterium]